MNFTEVLTELKMDYAKGVKPSRVNGLIAKIEKIKASDKPNLDRLKYYQDDLRTALRGVNSADMSKIDGGYKEALKESLIEKKVGIPICKVSGCGEKMEISGSLWVCPKCGSRKPKQQ
jgi:hypothetical protein